MFEIVILASAGGGNFEAVVKQQEEYGYKIKKLIVDRKCGAIEKAEKYNIPWENAGDRGKEYLMEKLLESIPKDTDLIVLCGWLPILQNIFLDKWQNKVINIHPSLLPAYGGKGMYGVKVHEAVMRNKEKYTGCTVHYVNDKIDDGAIILQEKMKIEYEHISCPWELGGKVFRMENELIVRAIVKLMREKEGAEREWM